jgi:hypothetical protein
MLKKIIKRIIFIPIAVFGLFVGYIVIYSILTLICLVTLILQPPYFMRKFISGILSDIGDELVSIDAKLISIGVKLISIRAKLESIAQRIQK